nr:hypothetical protein C5F59_26880 [Streptomyces sp. QL37]
MVLVFTGAAPALFGVLPPRLRALRQVRLWNGPRQSRRFEARLDSASRRPADELRFRWEREERPRRVQHLAPLDVRWENEDAPADHRTGIPGEAARDAPVDLCGASTRPRERRAADAAPHVYSRARFSTMCSSSRSSPSFRSRPVSCWTRASR